MKTYRIKEFIFPDGDKSYEIQRKSILGFWYNAYIEAYTMRAYNSFDRAKEALEQKLIPIKTKIVYKTS
jgi:hypothetical protein